MKLKSQTLYVQVQEILIQRISDAVWGAGTLLPNEHHLAEEFGVSHGTIRKALDGLEKKGLIVRKQGRGTYVATHSPGHDRGQFFALFDKSGEQLLPDSQLVDLSTGEATPVEAERLLVAPGAEVLRIVRTRAIDGKIIALETIVVSVDLFPGLGGTRGQPTGRIPSFLYPHFHDTYGVLVVHASERITAVLADAPLAEVTGLAVGEPVLKLDRIAHDLDGNPVEWRIRQCALGDGHYLAELSL